VHTRMLDEVIPLKSGHLRCVGQRQV